MDHPIFTRMRELGFAVFTDGDYDLNIVGIRKANGTPNRFDDTLHCIYRENGAWVDRFWSITTDPGTYWLENPGRSIGTAAVVADRQYRGCWAFGKHRGSYEALVQVGPIDVHRDDNRDAKVDYRMDNIQRGTFGINCHRSTTREGGSYSVDKWSAGCQVFQKPGDFEEFLSICRKQRDIRGWSRFTYTLLNEF